MRWLLVVAIVAAGVGLVAFDVVAAPYVFGPLLGVAIWKVGTASLASLRRGAEHVPDGGAPEPIDVTRERVVYWCEGCGTELLLLARGTPAPPRHCGERMIEHRDHVEVGQPGLD